MDENEKLIPVFIPPLSALLLRAEQLKAAPLTQSEVLKIRDNGVCMMMAPAMAEQLAAKRGYPDLDPENCWQDWLAVRAEAQNDAP